MKETFKFEKGFISAILFFKFKNIFFCENHFSQLGIRVIEKAPSIKVEVH
jgi:hypothetical protein